MKNIFTIDLEEWFHANYSDDVFDTNKSYEVRVVDNTYKILDIFMQSNTKATFFVLGYIAKKYGELVRDIFDAGHEIASHGMCHKLVYRQSKDEFREDVHASKSLLEDIIQTKIKGYRAPSWSITNESLWALEILQELGFVYDSSIFPLETFMYGIKDAPRFMHKLTINGELGSIYEIPPSTFHFFKKTMGFSGGFYLRALPYAAIKFLTRRVNRLENSPVVFYLHPREIDKNQPKLKLRLVEHVIHYLNISGCEKKLRKITDEFDLTSIEECFGF